MIGHECPNCPSILTERDGYQQCVSCQTIVRDVCWVNEDCILGPHAVDVECRLPTWTDDANEPCPTCGRGPEPKHEARQPHPLTQIGRQ